ncbi:MAG: hypothetical protein J6C85_05380 [Alphaproteobacteria bacterium]|nr:hypothetical protein [Alphaproteobacteria bacterium]
MKTVKLFNLPQEAKGQHKINKVRILRSSEGFDYAIILLDGDIVIKLLPEEDGFSEDAGLILLSEGKYLNF